MPASNLTKKTITIAMVDVKEKSVVIIDQDGVQYSFFRLKMDGTPTVAYSTFQEFKLAVNSIIDVGYKVNGKYKNIMAFRQPSEQAKVSTVPFIEKEVKPRDFEKEAYGKCLHGFLIEAFKLGLPINEETLKNCHLWAKASMTGEIVLPKWTGQKPPTLTDEVTSENIPF